jgi:2-polyprenyl-3-methyl-5-hydroxy-6-metoxy-1,4-benzoquinol methylase
MNDPGVERLRSRGTSPFPPAPPRRHPLVSLAFRVAQRRGGATATPHLHGGADREKAVFEHRDADSFWDAFGGTLDVTALEGLDVLDAGCGWGGKAVSYAERSGLRSIVGFDLPGEMDPAVPDAFASERGVGELCTFLAARAEAMPFEDRSFDLVIMDDVLEHVEDPGQVLRECHRVLRPGGRLAVKFPSVRMPYAHHLDRAIAWPAIHAVLPLRTWVAGLNHELLHADGRVSFEPFDAVTRTPWHRAVPRNLNGLDFAGFCALVDAAGFETRFREIIPMGITPSTPLKRAALAVYRLAWRSAWLRERLGNTIGFVGARPAG